MNGYEVGNEPVRLSEADMPEIFRLLGCGKQSPDPDTQSRVRRCMEQVNGAADPRWMLRNFQRFSEIESSPDDCFPVECSFLSGQDIVKHLDGCYTIVLLAATVGPGVDTVIRRASFTNVADQLTLDMCGSVLIERLCDTVEARLRFSASQSNEFVTGRFSPGYGDLPLGCQHEFIRIMDSARRIGLGCNDSGLLIPVKSVTAILGVSKKTIRETVPGCGACGVRETCEYRIRGTPCGGKIRDIACWCYGDNAAGSWYACRCASGSLGIAEPGGG